MIKTTKGRISKESFDYFLESEAMKAEGITKTVMALHVKTDMQHMDRL
jgi:hypothetical protein